MNSTATVMQQVESRLIGLGYAPSSIEGNLRTSSGSEVDLVVFEREQPTIVLEIVIGSGFPDRVDSTNLTFHPVVRTAQRLAKEMGAQYYAVANGESILWFETDRNGRPKLMSSPILPIAAQGTATRGINSRELVTRALFRLLDVSREMTDTARLDLCCAVAVYARVQAETGDPTLHDALMEPQANPVVLAVTEEKLHLSSSLSRDQAFFSQALNIVDRVSFFQVPTNDLLAAFDEFLFLRLQPSGFRLPRWLTDLFVQLSAIQTKAQVLDIYSNFGDVAVALAMTGRDASITSIVSHPVSYVWANIQQLLLKPKGHAQVLFGDTPPLDLRRSAHMQRPTRIIVASPFGAKIPSVDQRKRLSEDVYLSMAMDWVAPEGRIVAIVPEGLLFSQSQIRRELREDIIANTSVKAILSLDALVLNTNVSTSILVIDKTPKRELDGVVMGHIERSDIPHSLENATSCLGIQRIAQLLEAFRSPERGRVRAASAWLTPIGDLTAKSFTIRDYEPGRRQRPLSLYKTIGLGDMAEIFKGSPLTLDEGGDLLVIGPKSVRKLAIDAAKLDRTRLSRIPSNPVVAQLNDVVVNALDKYRGNAALVDSEFAGLHISRNIIVVRPTSSQVLPAYLVIALNSKFVTDQVQDKTTGSVIPQITKGALLETLIPIPDLELQRQIVEQATRARDEWLLALQKLSEYEQRLAKAEEAIDSLLEHLHSGGGAQ